MADEPQLLSADAPSGMINLDDTLAGVEYGDLLTALSSDLVVAAYLLPALAGTVPEFANGFAATQLSFGSGSVAFSGATLSGTTVITHGLGKAPQLAAAFCTNAADAAHVTTFNTFSLGATQFSVNGVSAGATTGSCPFFWVALA